MFPQVVRQTADLQKYPGETPSTYGSKTLRGTPYIFEVRQNRFLYFGVAISNLGRVGS